VAILGGGGITTDNTFNEVYIYNSGSMEATTGETIVTQRLQYTDISNDDDSDANTRFIHNSGTVVMSGSTPSLSFSSPEDSNVPGITGGSGMPALSDTYGIYNLIAKPSTTFGLGGGGKNGISGDFTIDTAGYGWMDRENRVGGNLNINQGEFRIDGSNKNLWVNGNIVMVSGTTLGGSKASNSHPYWIGWMMCDGNVILGKDSELYLASGASASDKWDFTGTKIGGNWINNGGSATE
jgi:hypothetical protein